jgi:hypothetical protein
VAGPTLGASRRRRDSAADAASRSGTPTDTTAGQRQVPQSQCYVSVLRQIEAISRSISLTVTGNAPHDARQCPVLGWLLRGLNGRTRVTILLPSLPDLTSTQ